MEVSVEYSSIPSNIQEVDKPVPVPSSRNLQEGFELAKVLNNEHVNTSEAIVKTRKLCGFVDGVVGSRKLLMDLFGHFEKRLKTLDISSKRNLSYYLCLVSYVC